MLTLHTPAHVCNHVFQQAVLVAPALSDAAAPVTTISSSTVVHPMSVGDRSDTDAAEYTSDSSSGALVHGLPVEEVLPTTVSSHLAEVSN
jgi:hypothetical protein